MAENKTQATAVSVGDFIAAVPDPVRRADAEIVSAMMERLSGEPPVMWGPSIIGFGKYHYRYESGREGDACRIGFSPRKAELVFYLGGTVANQQALLGQLGKYRGTGCIYVRKLSDVDMRVLEELIVRSLAHMDEHYPR